MILNKLFFSYSRTDAADFTLKLALDLKKEGFNVWIDQQDIRAGTEWDLEIEKALETCDCLLFIESEKSVVSNNVLDEVYYALEQRKRVIPIIYHDSKTPFRLQRLQHIDFSKDYETGLVSLIKELKREEGGAVLQYKEEGEAKQVIATFFTKYSRFLLAIASLLIIALIVVIFYTDKNKEELNELGDKVITRKDTVVKDQQPVAATDSIAVQQDEVVESKEVNEKKSTANPGIKTVKKPTNKIVEPIAPIATIYLAEDYAGEWELVEVQPRVASQRGYLKLEALDEKKVKILSNFQFYFFKKNALAYFSVFNGFAACSSCALQKEIKITDKDIAFGSNRYEILKQDEPGGEGKAGDTVMTGGGNNTISARVTLHLINTNSIIIKVQQTVPTPVDNGLVVEPFVYSFRFRKRA